MLVKMLIFKKIDYAVAVSKNTFKCSDFRHANYKFVASF